VRTFFGQGRGVLQIRAFVLFEAKSSDIFEIYGLSARTREEGVEPVRTMGRGSIYCDFVCTSFTDGPQWEKVGNRQVTIHSKKILFGKTVIRPSQEGLNPNISYSNFIQKGSFFYLYVVYFWKDKFSGVGVLNLTAFEIRQFLSDFYLKIEN